MISRTGCVIIWLAVGETRRVKRVCFITLAGFQFSFSPSSLVDLRNE